MLEVVKSSNTAIQAPEQQILARMEAARSELARAVSISEVKRIVDGAAAMCEWLRRQEQLGLEIVNDGNLLKLQAERRIGEFLKQPGAVKTQGRPEKTPNVGGFPPPSHKDLGITSQAAVRYRQVAAIPEAKLTELASLATARGRELTREAVIQEAKAQERQRAKAEAPPLPPDEPLPAIDRIPAHLRNTIVTGDARQLAAEIPDHSVSVCFCDPVYERIEDYAWLARECERVLIPGGSVIAQIGNVRRFEAECAMRESGLQWVDLLVEVYPFALCPLHHIRVQVGFKPYLWMSLGPRADMKGRNLIAPVYQGDNSGWLMNRVHAKGKRSSDASKDLHEWGDAEDFACGILERLCGPGDVVWDPFAGSGLVPVVAKRLGLPFVASEINPESAQKGRDRLSGIRRREGVMQGSLWESA